MSGERPRLLDLFCGAGGSARGYQDAGFYVVGVDKEPQPNYCGDSFFRADALAVLRHFLRGEALENFDALHASPPCQLFSQATGYHRAAKEGHVDLITPTRLLLRETGLPFVIENVPGAPLRKDVLLCGEMFGLRLHRHRYFETEGFLVMQPRHSLHNLRGAKHNCHIEEGHARQVAGHYADHEDASDAMGIDWMDRAELAEAIPPAYTEFIGQQLRLAHLSATRKAAA